jgi:DNA polymerase iota
MQMEQRMGYTSTVGISTSKLLSKLVGNVNKPRGQTTLLPPYETDKNNGPSNVTSFMDAHDVGKVPEIGFKMSHKLREYALKRLGRVEANAMHTYKQAGVTVGDLRTLPGVDARILEDVLAGPGMQRGVGFKTWCLLHGVDDSQVAQAKDIPKQISIEDSYLRMDTFENVQHELLTLSISLIRRMREDLTEEESSSQVEDQDNAKLRKWLAHPKTLRLSTRPRLPPGADGRRGRASNRISRSANLPPFVFSLSEPIETLAEKLVQECLIALFRQLHPEKQGWDLSLINVAVTNMVDTAGTSKAAVGRDISKMFKTQEKTLQPWKVEDVDMSLSEGLSGVFTDETMAPDNQSEPELEALANGSEDTLPLSQGTYSSDVGNHWYESDEDDQPSFAMSCPLCGAAMPDFAIAAHLRFHETND